MANYQFENIIKSYLDKRAKEDSLFAVAYQKANKSIKECCNYRKRFNGSLDKILKSNSEADKNHVSLKVRKEISESLRQAFMKKYPDYKEPASQMELFKY